MKKNSPAWPLLQSRSRNCVPTSNSHRSIYSSKHKWSATCLQACQLSSCWQVSRVTRIHASGSLQDAFPTAILPLTEFTRMTLIYIRKRFHGTHCNLSYQGSLYKTLKLNITFTLQRKENILQSLLEEQGLLALVSLATLAKILCHMLHADCPPGYSDAIHRLHITAHH